MLNQGRCINPSKQCCLRSSYTRDSAVNVKVTVNTDGIEKPTTWLSNGPKITERLSDVQRSRQVESNRYAVQLGSLAKNH